MISQLPESFELSGSWIRMVIANTYKQLIILVHCLPNLDSNFPYQNTMDFSQQLQLQKRDFLIKANGGIALPAAGTIYWLALGVAGLYLKPQTWFLVGAFSSGLIFPLGILLSKPLKSNIFVSTPLSDLIAPALISMLMFWPLAIAGSSANISFFPLALAVGMGMHWPVIGWMYGKRVFLYHGIARAVGCTMLWYIFPDQRFVIIPAFVSVVYLASIVGIKREVNIAVKEVISAR